MPLLSLLLALPLARAVAWTPLRVAVECQSTERVEACIYLRGHLDALPSVAVVPRSEAQVALYVNASRVGTIDKVFLRVVGELPGAPAVFEQLVDVDSRATVDDQRAALEPALLRVLAPSLIIVLPGAVTVQVETPPAATQVQPDTSPWGFSVWGGGWGSWSGDYQSLDVWTGGSVYRKTKAHRQKLWVSGNRSVSREPSLTVDGIDVALTSDSASLSALFVAANNLSDHWSVGSVARGGADDPEGQYLGTARLHLGPEYNWFPSDDPRGNKLSLSYLVGGQVDAYNEANALGEERALFPTHMLLAAGEVRFDTISLGVDLSAAAELLHPERRYVLGLEVEGEIAVGDHVDLYLGGGVTRQAIPGPGGIDTSSYEEVTRASYAEPFSIYGDFNLSLHWDNTNSARNNRFETPGDLDATGNL